MVSGVFGIIFAFKPLNVFGFEFKIFLMMNKSYHFFSAIGFIVVLSLIFGARCRRPYNELGPDSVFFKFNGKPVIPSDVHFRPDSLAMVHINAFDSIHLYFYLKNYHGAGIYTFGPGDTIPYVDCAYYSRDFDNFYTIPQGDTYINVLEHDTASGLFHAVFEARLADSAGHSVKITEGRIFINVPYDY